MAHTFMVGLEAALGAGVDIVANTAADNQYQSAARRAYEQLYHLGLL